MALLASANIRAHAGTVAERSERRYPVLAAKLFFLIRAKDGRKNWKGEADIIGRPQFCQS
jgi:hypothetical protein